MQERRQFMRRRILKGARILLSGHRAALTCTARDISDGGVGIAVASPVGVPDDFDLLFDNEHEPRHCQVKWRSTERIGAAFC